MARRRHSPSLSESESASSPSSDSEDRLCSPARKTSKRSTKVHQNQITRNQSKSSSTIYPLAVLLTVRRSKKKKSSANPREELYIAAARCITRCIDRFCKIDKVIDIDTLLKRHELADAGQLSEDEDDIAHRENQLAELYGCGVSH